MAAFVSADETNQKMLPHNQEYVLKEGTYPEKAQEIAAGRAFFDAKWDTMMPRSETS